MIDYHSELQALVDACESFAVPIRGQRIPWQTALDRARAALVGPEPEESPQPVPVLSEGTPIIEPPDHTLFTPIAQPIPVSERLPGLEDCDAAGMCWWWCFPTERWLRCGIPKPDPTSQIHTHWLPAHALSLPNYTTRINFDD